MKLCGVCKILEFEKVEWMIDFQIGFHGLSWCTMVLRSEKTRMKEKRGKLPPVMECTGWTSIQFVLRSMKITRYPDDELLGSGPTTSVFHNGIVPTFAVVMKWPEVCQFMIDSRCRWKQLTLMLRLMMCRRLVDEKGSRLHLLILRYVEFRQGILLVEKTDETVEGCWYCSGSVEMNWWLVCGLWKQRYGVLQSDVWILLLLRR